MPGASPMDPASNTEVESSVVSPRARMQSTLQGFGFTASSSLQKPAVDEGAQPVQRRLTRSASKNTLLPSLPVENSQSGAGLTRRRKSQSPEKSSTSSKRKRSAGYAPPSRYAHIDNNLSDSLVPGLICVFIGLNPGLTTATTGHAYAHSSNLFWRLLASSGCTPRRCAPSETHDLPRLYALGNTNIVARPTANGAELSREEMDAGVAILDEKVRKHKPQAVAIVGKSIWESIWRVWKGKAITKQEFKYGWQNDNLRMGKPKAGKTDEDGDWRGARVFVATTTSGLAASMSLSEKEAIWRELGEWVETQRQTSGSADDGHVESENSVASR